MKSRCKTVIHRGGAGTTAAGLRAGIPNIVIPILGDQRFWGKSPRSPRGPKSILLRDLSIEKLSHAIKETEERSLQKHAQTIGDQISSEDGTEEAVKWIEKYSNNFQRLC